MFIIEDRDNLFLLTVPIVDTILVMQLGVLATYAGDNLQALYHYLYSLAVPLPFTTARANAKLLFEKVYILRTDFKPASLTFLVPLNDACSKISELVCYGMLSRYIFVNSLVLGECKFEALRILFLIKFENLKFHTFMVTCRINIIILSFRTHLKKMWLLTFKWHNHLRVIPPSPAPNPTKSVLLLDCKDGFVCTSLLLLDSFSTNQGSNLSNPRLLSFVMLSNWICYLSLSCS